MTGWHRNTWEPDCTARYRLADIDGSRALGVSVDRPGSQLAFRMPAETFHGCPPGTALRVTFECRADGPAEGYCTVKALPTLRPLAELFVPNAGGWVRRSFTFPIPQEAQVEIAFRSASAIWVRGLEVTAEAGMPTTAEVVYETHFRGVQPFTRVLGTAAVVSGLDSPDILEAGWLYQRAEGSGSATFAATAREAETVLSVSATGSGAAQWVFHPDNGVSAALASNARYRVTVEYAAESAGELTAHERDVWVVLAVAKLPATRGWATAEMTFVTPPARGVQYAFAPASDGKPLRVRRLQLERLPDAPPSGKPVVSVDGSTFAALTYRVAHHEQVKGTGDGRLPNDWRFESYQKDGVAELATGSDRGHPHFAIRNVAGEGAQLYQYQPGAPLKAGVPHRVTVEYRTAAGTAACIELRDGDVSHWTDSPFKTCLPATDGEWVTRHYEIVPPRAWPPVLVLQNHTADAGNEFCVRRLTVTPLR